MLVQAAGKALPRAVAKPAVSGGGPFQMSSFWRRANWETLSRHPRQQRNEHTDSLHSLVTFVHSLASLVRSLARSSTLALPTKYTNSNDTRIINTKKNSFTKITHTIWRSLQCYFNTWWWCRKRNYKFSKRYFWKSKCSCWIWRISWCFWWIRSWWYGI